MGRRKYQFKDRAEAEAAFKKAEQEAREMQWFAKALVDGRVVFKKVYGGNTRFATFTPNPQIPWSEPLIVEEFKPPTGQDATYTVYDQHRFLDREADMVRARRRTGADPEIDGWLDGARVILGEAARLPNGDFPIKPTEIETV